MIEPIGELTVDDLLKIEGSKTLYKVYEGTYANAMYGPLYKKTYTAPFVICDDGVIILDANGVIVRAPEPGGSHVFENYFLALTYAKRLQNDA